MVENIRDTVETIGTSASVICLEQHNAQRSVLILTNTSPAAQIINLSFGGEAQVGKGVQLSVGGYYTEAIDAGFKPTNKQITAISSAAGGTLTIHERILQDSYRY